MGLEWLNKDNYMVTSPGFFPLKDNMVFSTDTKSPSIHGRKVWILFEESDSG